MQRKTWMRGVVLIAALALVSAGCGGSEDSKACDNAQEVTEQPEAAAASWALYYSVLNDRDIITEGIYYRFPYLCDTWTFNSDLLPIGMPVRHEIEDGRAVDAGVNATIDVQRPPATTKNALAQVSGRELPAVPRRRPDPGYRRHCPGPAPEV